MEKSIKNDRYIRINKILIGLSMKDLKFYVEDFSGKSIRYMSDDVRMELEERTYRCLGGIRERLYWVRNNIEDYPECKNCGMKLTSRNFIKNGVPGYRDYCGKKCSKVNLNYDIINKKRKLTNIERYGTEGNPWYFQKFRDYLKNKYGIDFIEIDKCLKD